MPVRRKVFRIEEMIGARRAPAAAGAAATDHPRAPTSGRRVSGARTRERPAAAARSPARRADETDTIARAIGRTKQEIATLHAGGFDGKQSGRAFRELDAVVDGTERATAQILAAAEEIDEAANNLSALLKGTQEQALAQDIRDQVIRIFEACNFQDLTAQRIATVIATLQSVEDHIGRMMEIWGGVDAFKDCMPVAAAERTRATVPLNGPKLDGDSGHATQDEIDDLFRSE